MRPTSQPHHLIRSVALAVVLGATSACTAAGPTEPDRSPAPTPAPSSSASDAVTPATTTEVRSTLGSLDPCALLGRRRAGAIALAYAEGPHTCEGQLGDVRVRVEVGVPFDDEDRDASAQGAIAGLAAYDDEDRCRVVLPTGPSHGIAVEVSDDCGSRGDAADVVGTALSTADDAAPRETPADSLSACGLIEAAVPDPDSLTDAVGDQSQGLDHCELTTGPPLARTRLSLGYTGVPFDKLLRLLRAERISVAGQDASLDRRGNRSCYLHTYLWPTTAPGRGAVWTEAVIGAATCAEAKALATAAIRVAGHAPVTAGNVSELLVPAD